MLHLENINEPFPSNFDFAFYFKGLLTTFDPKIDHAVSFTKALWLLYKTMHYYPIEYRAQIILELIGNKSQQ
jgi:hypothetical protein